MRKLLLAMSLAVAVPAYGHDAPTGWSYDAACCSNRDCREVPASYVQETWAGYHMTRSREILGYGDSRVKPSPDGLIHWCTQGGTDTGRTICLYMPPRGM